jgi:hypothetical protein
MKRFRNTVRFSASSVITAALAVVMAAMINTPALAGGIKGAIFTTTVNGSAVNANIYGSTCDVYLDGGPGPKAPATAAGLPDGDYYFQVTDPSGVQLLSTDSVSNRRFHVTGGIITAFTGTGGPAHATGIDQDHSAITISLANSTCPTDFLPTPNNGNEYKVWATPVASYIGNPANVDNPCGSGCFHGFLPAQSKTDNFKAQVGVAQTFCLTIQKQFTDGVNPPYPDLLGWGMTVTDMSGVPNTYITDAIAGQVMVCQLPQGTYTVTEDPTAPLPLPYNFTSPTVFLNLNGMLQSTASPTVTFSWDPTQSTSVTVRFVNLLLTVTIG